MTSLPSQVRAELHVPIKKKVGTYRHIVADFSAQAVINTYLTKAFPEDPIVGEEDAKDLRGEAGRALREKVVSLTNGVLSPEEQLTEEQVGQIKTGSLSRCSITQILH